MRPPSYSVSRLAYPSTAGGKNLLYQLPSRLRGAHYSTTPPSPSPGSRSTMPYRYLIGAVAGIGAVGVAGYTWYQMSTMKRVVDGAAAAKARFNETKEAVAETREAAKVKAADVSASVKEKSANIKERLRRYRSEAAQKAGNGREDTGPNEDSEEQRRTS
ncbi:hypothetical protein GY45DRAFT_1325308 [Cubamyces sp. BRFM 1775]|nr:hypothetical protein GY45DRAFT_1325308 [Cubamyces sp. BRFM 1775]